RSQKIRVRDATNLDRILEREEDTRTSPLLRFHVEEILAVVLRGPGDHRVRWMAGKHLRERALARTVRTHDRVDFALADREIHTLQDLGARDGNAKAFHFEQRHLAHTSFQ